MPSPTVRTATPADLDALARLFDAYRVFYRQDPDIPRSRAFLAERMERGESVIFIAEIDGRGAGFAQLYPGFTSVGLGTRWTLNDLFVDPDLRGRGVGRALTERCMDHARETGAAGLELLTETDNASAQALYESLGWKRRDDYHRYTYYFAP